jgi:hypothetical protein
VHHAVLLVSLAAVQACASTHTHLVSPRPAIRPSSLAPYTREELFFGLSRDHGGTVSDGEWRAFLRDVVTPLFPGGLTTIDGSGQWRDSTGVIAREGTKILIILYATDDSAAVRGQRIDMVRSEYVHRFDQASVLRVTSQVRASF